MQVMQEQAESRSSLLKGKTALVTGGGRGLGRAVCEMLASSGAAVAVADIAAAPAKDTAESLKSAGGEAADLCLDVSDPEQAQESVLRTVERFGRLDILINNAAVDATLPVEELTADQWNRIIRVNLNAPFLMSKFAFPHMKEAGGGNIVNIVSTAAKRAWANASAYHASKWGLLGLSHALHVEGRPHGIKVTAVVSGGMRTPFLLDRFPDIDPKVLQDPRNVAETVRFVLSQPGETVIPEIMVLPMRETSWP